MGGHSSVTGSGGERQVSAWATEPPAAPGWYWLREFGGEPRCVRLAVYNGDGVLRLGYMTVARMEGCEWCGPLPVPNG